MIVLFLKHLYLFCVKLWSVYDFFKGRGKQ